MLIQICDADKNGKRPIRVMDGETEVFTSVADDLAAAHKLVRRGNRDGWETVTPEALAAETKAAAVKEGARVEGGKKAAEPKTK